LAFQFKKNGKFAILALDGVYSDLPNAEFRLSDGTWVMPRVPAVADLGVWKEWIGSIRAGSLQRSNLVLLAEEESRNPLILDEDHYRLRSDLAQLFYFLHFRQGIECAGANEPDLLCGSCKEGNPIIRQMNKLPAFYQSKGYTRAAITEAWISDALALRSAATAIESATDEFQRLIRGLNVLFAGLRESGQGRLHQLVRSLEALVLPDTGKTRNQFVIAAKHSRHLDRMRNWRCKRRLTCVAIWSICRTGTGQYRPTYLQSGRMCAGREPDKSSCLPATRTRESCLL
jgi:hypothetical protein